MLGGCVSVPLAIPQSLAEVKKADHAYLRKAYRNSSSERLPDLLSDAHFAPFGTGSAEIRETSNISTKKLASRAVVTSFIEASSASLAYINLLDVGSTKRLTASTEATVLDNRR
jgi:hypothetical protein